MPIFSDGVWVRIMLLIVLTALMINGVTVLHIITEEAPSPVCEHHTSTHDLLIIDDSDTPAGITNHNSKERCHYPQRDNQLSSRHYDSIFHPPQVG